jgi:hypothetical protein
VSVIVSRVKGERRNGHDRWGSDAKDDREQDDDVRLWKEEEAKAKK